MGQRRLLFVVTALFAFAATVEAFVPSGPSVSWHRAQVSANTLKLSEADAAEGVPEEEENSELTVKPTVRIIEGGSNLTDRFKYKMNALMGAFDPKDADDENQEGGILNAMLDFPVRYTFNIVGRTEGDDETRDQYVDEVKKIILGTSGDEDGITCKITPRGNFTKLQVEVEVFSVTMINTIYDLLGKLDRTKMRF
jgi:putative lipoic acid-binding regulatory protein